MSEVQFKSLFANWAKEKSGVKPNTVRRIEIMDDRFHELFSGQATQIRILDPASRRSFVRKITDVTEFEGYAIISWRHK